ncbi:MAG: hypothetical protein M3N17_01265 [Actinomycetota bacterium]|nr:hypothetical protein [Actinomycetota bacterium]
MVAVLAAAPMPFVVISQALFLGGAVFSYMVIPRGLQLMLGFAGPNVVSRTRSP